MSTGPFATAPTADAAPSAAAPTTTADTGVAAEPACGTRSAALPLPVLGADVRVPLVTGGEVGYAALDYAASAPALRRVWEDVAAYAPYYGSVHRVAGYPLAVVHRPVRDQPCGRGRVPRLPPGRPGRLHPLHYRLAQPARRRAARGHAGVRLRDRAPRRAAALGAAAGRVGDLPERAPFARRRRADVGGGAGGPGGRGSCAGLRDRRVERDRRAVAGARVGGGARARRPDRARRRPVGAPTTRSTSPSWTWTGSRSPATSCTRRSAPACSPAALTGCARPSRTSPWRCQSRRGADRRRRRGRGLAHHRRPARGRLRRAGRARAGADRRRTGRTRRRPAGASPVAVRRRRAPGRGALLRRGRLEQLTLRRRALRRVRHRRVGRAVLRPPAGAHPARQRGVGAG